MSSYLAYFGDVPLIDGKFNGSLFVMSLKLNVSMIIISFLCMINSRILHVSIDIVIQFSNVEMYKNFLVLDTCYGYLFIILYNDLLVALAKNCCHLIT